MTQREWLEAFKQIHGRNPSPMELHQAKENVEYDIAVPSSKSWLFTVIFIMPILLLAAFF